MLQLPRTTCAEQRSLLRKTPYRVSRSSRPTPLKETERAGAWLRSGIADSLSQRVLCARIRAPATEPDFITLVFWGMPTTHIP